MGRHAAPDAGSFYRSLGVAVLRGLFAVALAAALYLALASIERPAADPPDGPVVSSPSASPSR